MKTLKKRALMLLALAVVMSANLSAQISKNVVDTTKQWNVCYSSAGITTYAYKILDVDTIIHDKTYYSLVRLEWYDTLSQTWNIWNHRDWIREDSGRVYVLTNHALDTNGTEWTVTKSVKEGKEYLLYDFNLQVGDTIDFVREYDVYSVRMPFAPPVVVFAVDSVEIEQSFHKRIYFKDATGYTEIWIEGIGSDKGLLESFTRSSYVLLCLKSNGETVYYYFGEEEYTPWLKSNTCYMRVGIQDIRNSGITIYPTATKSIINITTTNFPIDISIVDIYGRCVKRDVITGNTQIDITDLASGIYTIICNQNGIVFNQKIIKL